MGIEDRTVSGNGILESLASGLVATVLGLGSLGCEKSSPTSAEASALLADSYAKKLAVQEAAPKGTIDEEELVKTQKNLKKALKDVAGGDQSYREKRWEWYLVFDGEGGPEGDVRTPLGALRTLFYGIMKGDYNAVKRVYDIEGQRERAIQEIDENLNRFKGEKFTQIKDNVLMDVDNSTRERLTAACREDQGKENWWQRPYEIWREAKQRQRTALESAEWRSFVPLARRIATIRDVVIGAQGRITQHDSGLQVDCIDLWIYEGGKNEPDEALLPYRSFVAFTDRGTLALIGEGRVRDRGKSYTLYGIEGPNGWQFFKGDSTKN